MKKIINGLLYDTDKADEICDWWNGLSNSDFRNISETLYRTEKGNWFIAGTGGAMSKYSEKVGDMASGSSRIVPITDEKARQFIAEHGSIDQYKKYFKIEEA